MRLFVAAELPDPLLDALAETSARLRESLPGRFVGSDLFHVTLAFLGEVPALQVADVVACIARACARQAAFVTSLGALGSFGRRSSAVLWQGFDEGLGAWKLLAREVRAELATAGLRCDGKGFLPHVTLMRRADLHAGVLPMPCVERSRIDTVTVFSSDLSQERPSYEALERVALGPGAWSQEA